MAKDVFGGGFLSPNANAAAATPDADAWRQWIQQTQAAGGLAMPGTAAFEAIPAVQQTRARDAEEQRVNALDARYGTDLSWLDPSFQYSPELLGQSAGSQAYADPAAIAAQNSAMQQAQQYATSNLSFQDPAQQQALMQQWAGIQSGQGAPTFMGNSQQQALMQQLLGVQAPQFQGDGDQRSVLNAAMGLINNTGQGSLQFDTSGRQGEQYGNLQDIIRGGGATAIEMADRQRARADSEAWLRGQREADMADYAERGLTGSGMELLNLSADRQAAAGRNSQADLDTAKALEERRLGAINSAAGLATNMRGQTIDEQGLLNNRATAGLGAATSLTNNMRSSDIQEQLGLNTALQNQFKGAADIAGQMRTQDYNEQSYLDKRITDALAAQTDLSTKMRDQQASEQIGNRNAQLSALSTLGSTSSAARNSSAQEAQYRATSADDFSTLNQGAINKAKSENTNALQQAYNTMMNNRAQWDTTLLNSKTNLAVSQQQADAIQNAAGFTQGTNLGASDATTWNNLSQELRNQIMGIFGQGQANQAAASQAGNAAAGQIAAGGVGAAGTIAGAIAGGVGGGAAAGGATAAQGAATGAQIGSQALTQKDEEARLRRSLAGGSFSGSL